MALQLLTRNYGAQYANFRVQVSEQSSGDPTALYQTAASVRPIVRNGVFVLPANGVMNTYVPDDRVYKLTLLSAGVHVGYARDLDGKQRPNPPSIGAFDVATLKKA